MRVIHPLKMDLVGPWGGNLLHMVQGDSNTRVVELQLFSNETEWIPTNVGTVSVAFKKPDQTKGLYDAEYTLEGNILQVVLHPQVLTAAGKVVVSIIIFTPEGNSVASFPFGIMVDKNPSMEILSSEDYVNGIHPFIAAAIQEAHAAAMEAYEAAELASDLVGLIPKQIEEHNLSEDSHQDIRLTLKSLNDRLTAFFDSDEQTLDELSEIVAYITSNKSLIDSITINKISVKDIVDNLVTNVSNKPLSAAQGVVLKGLVDQAANMGYVNAQVRKAAPRNLLDNSDFTNPVNQRGNETWNTDGYTVDRWKMTVDIGIINKGSNGLQLDATNNAITFTQFLDDSAWQKMLSSGKKYTLAMHYTVENAGSGRIYAFQRNKNSAVKGMGELPQTVGTHTAVKTFTPDAATGDAPYSPCWLYTTNGFKLVLHWIALYEGEYTIDTLPEYQPKGYAAELAECQRYYYRIDEWFHFGFGNVDWDGVAVSINVPVGTRMRKIPSIPENIPIHLRMGKNEGMQISGKTPTVNRTGNIITLSYQNVFSADDGRMYQPVIAQMDGTPMEFIADL